jgi:predicted transcriptional regulator
MDETRRRAILAEIAALAVPAFTMEPYMFTVMDLAEQLGVHRAQAERYARRQVAAGVWRMNMDGYDPRKGRKAALYWRVEDEQSCQ